MTKIKNLIDDYTDYLQYERTVTKQTLQAYLSDINRLMEAIGNTDIEDVTLSDLRQHMRDMKEAGLANATIRRRIHSLNTFYGWLVLEGIVDEQISRKLHLPKRHRKQPVWLSDDEIKRFAETPSRLSIAWQLMAWFGLRRSEILKLDWKDIRLQDKVLIVRDTKSKKDRVMPIPKALLPDLLEAWKNRDMPESGSVVGIGKSPFVRAFKKHLKNCGLSGKGITPHTLRHSFASSLIRQGVPLTVVKELLGHKDVSTTMIYIHHSDELLQDAMDKHILGK